MKAAVRVLLGMAVVFAVVLIARAEEKDEKKKDKEEVTLKGEITCSKCGLKETDKCGNAIKVKKDGKEIVFYFKDKGKGEKYHKEVCTSTKPGSVTGTVSKEKDKNYITPAKDGVKFD